MEDEHYVTSLNFKSRIFCVTLYKNGTAFTKKTFVASKTN